MIFLTYDKKKAEYFPCGMYLYLRSETQETSLHWIFLEHNRHLHNWGVVSYCTYLNWLRLQAIRFEGLMPVKFRFLVFWIFTPRRHPVSIFFKVTSGPLKKMLYFNPMKMLQNKLHSVCFFTFCLLRYLYCYKCHVSWYMPKSWIHGTVRFPTTPYTLLFKNISLEMWKPLVC